MTVSALAAALAGGPGFGGAQSALEPAGPQSARLYDLGLWMTVAGGAVWIGVTVLLLVAARRATARGAAREDEGTERRLGRLVGAGIAGTAVVLVSLLAATFVVGNASSAFADPDALQVEVTGEQWWWRVEYAHPVPAMRVTTANEIHVPVGRRVTVRLRAADVIHSFWVPSLHGKTDLIPGYVTSQTFQVDTPGVYRGQCAEYCGVQHARMSLLVVAHDTASYAAWYRAQLAPGRPPATPEEHAGRAVFEARSCALCHAVRGTDAGASAGPDLTHVGSRLTLAAGTLPNTPGHLGGWVVDPQGIKPGTRMPPNDLSPHELRSLLAYLRSLK
jgi:cytochrome c oxidase subunit 2